MTLRSRYRNIWAENGRKQKRFCKIYQLSRSPGDFISPCGSLRAKISAFPHFPPFCASRIFLQVIANASLFQPARRIQPLSSSSSSFKTQLARSRKDIKILDIARLGGRMLGIRAHWIGGKELRMFLYRIGDERFWAVLMPLTYSIYTIHMRCALKIPHSSWTLVSGAFSSNASHCTCLTYTKQKLYFHFIWYALEY